MRSGEEFDQGSPEAVMMKQELAGTIDVEYTFREGYHIFTSPDLSGFYVASKDAEKAVSEIPEVIKLLMRLNEGVECNVEMPTSFDDFLISLRSRALHPGEMLHRAVELGSRTYVLKCA